MLIAEWILGGRCNLLQAAKVPARLVTGIALNAGWLTLVLFNFVLSLAQPCFVLR